MASPTREISFLHQDCNFFTLDSLVHFERFTGTMPLPVQGGFQRGPSCWDRVKMGFTIGFCVGMASGALFGGFSALRYGLRGRELIQSVGKVMLQGGGTFGTFMSIGTAIRC
ncbi:reactive oxygen species modulator 1-like [Ixodes scapularis]